MKERGESWKSTRGKIFLLTCGGRELFCFPDGETAQKAISDDSPPSGITEIARLIPRGTPTSPMLSTVPEPVRVEGKIFLLLSAGAVSNVER